MADLNSPNSHYFEPKGDNATAENICGVLNDLTDIAASGDVEDGKDTVKWTGEKFELGKDYLSDIANSGEIQDNKDTVKWNGEEFYLDVDGGGTDVPEIEGDENVVLVCDGDGYAKVNEAAFSMTTQKIDGDTISTAQLSTTQDKLEISRNTSIDDMETYYGRHTIPVPNDPPVENIWAYKHGLINIQDGNSSIYMSKNNSDNSPVIAMTGGSIIDMRIPEEDGPTYLTRAEIVAKGDQDSREATNLSFSQQIINFNKSFYPHDSYDKVPSSSGNVPQDKTTGEESCFPYFSMYDNGTVVIEDNALLNMKGGSSILTDGCADVRITGGHVENANGWTTSGGIVAPTIFWVKPGSNFIMQSTGKADNYGPLFMMTVDDDSDTKNSQILLTNANKTPTYNGKNYSYTPWYFQIPGSLNQISTEEGSNGYEPFLQSKTENIYMQWTIKSMPIATVERIGSRQMSTNLNDVNKSTFCVQGDTNIVIGDGGKLAARIGTMGASLYTIGGLKDSELRFEHNLNEKSCEEWQINNGKDSYQFIKFGTCENAKTSIVFTPGFAQEPASDERITSIHFAPQIQFSYECAPKYSDIRLQWNKLQAYIEGEDTFIVQKGNGHFELLDNPTIIMRKNDVLTTPTETIKTHLDKDWSRPVQNSATDGPISQIYGLSNLCMRPAFGDSTSGIVTSSDFEKIYNHDKQLTVEDYKKFLGKITAEVKDKIYITCFKDITTTISSSGGMNYTRILYGYVKKATETCTDLTGTYTNATNLNEQDLITFKEAIGSGKYAVGFESINTVGNTTTIVYGYTETQPYVESTGDPIIEVTDGSELRLHNSGSFEMDGEQIKFLSSSDSLTTTIGELKSVIEGGGGGGGTSGVEVDSTGVTFSSGSNSISFSWNELTQLKSLVNEVSNMVGDGI